MSLDLSVKSFRNKMRENSTAKYKIFLSVFLSLMVIFATSKLWLPSDVKIMNTAVGTELNTSQSTSIKLRSWEYSRTNHYMEIAFDVNNLEDNQSLTFVPTAHTNISKNKELNASTVLSRDNTLIIQVTDVPQKWDVISLWVKDIQNSASDDNGALSGANFFSDARQVVMNDSLSPKSSLSYQLEAVQNQIDDVQKQIADTRKLIDAENANISQLNFDVLALMANRKYQTKAEIDKSNSVIDSKTSEIDTHKDNILKYNNQIKDFNDKLKKLNQKLQDTKAGKVTEPTPPTSKIASVPQSSASDPAVAD